VSKSLLVTNDFPPKVGGIQSYLWELWKRLEPSSTSVLTARSHPDHERFDAEQRARGLRIRRVRAPILYLPTPFALARIRQACRAERPDIVLLDPAWPLGLLGPRLGVPYGVVLHGAELAIPARLPGIRAGLARVLRRASIVVSAGGYPRAEAERLVGERLDTVVEIPPGVDVDRFAGPPGDRADTRRRFGVTEAAPMVVSVSRLVPRKGMDVLIRAAARLADAHPGLVVLIAGGGRDEGRLRRLIERTGAPVRLIGRVSEDDKVALLSASDLFVVACRNRWGGLEQEGFGIVFVEAAAAGLPSVAGDSGGAAEAVADGETGLVVREPTDVGAVAAALERLLSDGALRERMGRSARERVTETFAYDALAPRLAEALAEVGG
jgi:phosphatidyl-myo-inositol dimannoside synthase